MEYLVPATPLMDIRRAVGSSCTNHKMANLLYICVSVYDKLYTPDGPRPVQHRPLSARLSEGNQRVVIGISQYNRSGTQLGMR